MDKQAWILKTVFDEVTEEIEERAGDDTELADETLAQWFDICSHLLHWVATGEQTSNEQANAFLLSIGTHSPELMPATNTTQDNSIQAHTPETTASGESVSLG
jgi:hypothetical protein